MKPFPLFGVGSVGKSPTITSQRRLNCYYEFRVDGDKTKIAVYGTPGLLLFKSVGGAPIRGGWAVGLSAYVVVGNILYKLDLGGTQSSLGTINTSTGTVSIIDNGTQMMIVDGTNGYILTLSSGALTQIVDGDFYNGATTVTFQDGFFLVENPAITGQFGKSALYDGMTWDALDNAVMVSNPCPSVAVDADHGYVIVFGTLAVEFWQNGGIAGFPFVPMRSAALEFGLAAKFSRAKCNGQICFLAQNKEGQVTVMKTVPGGAQKISDPDIDSIINSFSVKSDATGLAYMVDGHAMYEISFTTAGRSFLFDHSTEMWSEVQTGVDLVGRHIAQFAFLWNGNTFVTDYATGNLYTLSSTTNTDSGATIKRLIQTRHQSESMNEFSINDIYLDMETGVGLQSGQGSDPQICLQVSKDNGRTFGIERWMPIGKVGQYLRNVHWSRLGSATDFVLRFWMTDPVKFAIAAGYGEADAGPQ